MDEKRYMEAIERTMNDELTEKEKLSMLAMGYIGEVGEIVDILKKVIYHGHELDKDKLEKEMGDADWYRYHLMKHFGIDPEVVRIKNVMKLMERYENGFSEEASKARVDTKGS